MDQGPAIVSSLLHYVSFVAAPRSVKSCRPVFSFKHQIRHWLKVESLRIAMPVGPNLGASVFPGSNEWIVVRNSAIVVYSKNLSGQ